MVLWGAQIIHHQPYSALICVYLGGIVGAVAIAGRLSLVLIVPGLCYSLVVWIFEPILSADRLDSPGLILLSLLLLWALHAVGEALWAFRYSPR
jgi:hypothetical protein